MLVAELQAVHIARSTVLDKLHVATIDIKVGGRVRYSMSMQTDRCDV
jgi:hypothetical protein